MAIAKARCDGVVKFLEKKDIHLKLISMHFQLETLQEYRRSLITAAVTGKLEIGEVEADV